MTREELRLRAVGRAGAGFLSLLGRSLRFEIQGEERLLAGRKLGRPVILAFWHAWILPLAYIHRGQGIVVLTSQHGDGEYISRVIERLGFKTVRGSSSRGGARGLRGVIRAVREGNDIGYTPDGPRGPAQRFKRGGLVAARLTGAGIVPIAVRGTGVRRLDNWDRFAIPGPFAKIHVQYGEPRFIRRDADEQELARHALDLERALNALDIPPAPADRTEESRVPRG